MWRALCVAQATSTETLKEPEAEGREGPGTPRFQSPSEGWPPGARSGRPSSPFRRGPACPWLCSNVNLVPLLAHPAIPSVTYVRNLQGWAETPFSLLGTSSDPFVVTVPREECHRTPETVGSRQEGCVGGVWPLLRGFLFRRWGAGPTLLREKQHRHSHEWQLPSIKVAPRRPCGGAFEELECVFLSEGAAAISSG